MPVWWKDPNETKDYTLDWTPILVDDDTIIAVTYSIAPDFELTVVSSDFANNATIQVDDGTGTLITLNGRKITTCWLQSGVLDEVYSGTAVITTAKGRIEERTFEISIGLN